MPSRADLNMRANAVNVDHTAYPNDSKLEQAVLYAEKNLDDAVDAVTVATTAGDAAKVSGDKNV